MYMYRQYFRHTQSLLEKKTHLLSRLVGGNLSADSRRRLYHTFISHTPYYSCMSTHARVSRYNFSRLWCAAFKMLFLLRLCSIDSRCKDNARHLLCCGTYMWSEIFMPDVCRSALWMVKGSFWTTGFEHYSLCTVVFFCFGTLVQLINCLISWCLVRYKNYKTVQSLLKTKL